MDEIELDSFSGNTVADVRRHLLRRYPDWEIFFERRLLCSLNYKLVSLEESVFPNDEIAFFPMVTGG
ncbi:hypothetical protein CBR65_00915 [Cellvibrio sp. PSBB006]|nr:hypothetical protein CBR65_00915 [Cellvibrio sp. PSBB006]